MISRKDEVMMHKLFTGLALFLASLGLVFFSNVATAQAANKSVTLPDTYAGYWYVYNGYIKRYSKHFYSVKRFDFQQDQTHTMDFKAKNKSLKSLKRWFAEGSPVAYKKLSTGGYKMFWDKSNLGTLKRTTVKINGRRVVALKMKLMPGNYSYDEKFDYVHAIGFRKPRARFSTGYFDF